eukprot:m.68860 g.68860  ORF g.68860 m.68860 type:complete len:563 (-) comp19933_c0_seq2:92-1780(-)
MSVIEMNQLAAQEALETSTDTEDGPTPNNSDNDFVPPLSTNPLHDSSHDLVEKDSVGELQQQETTFGDGLPHSDTDGVLPPSKRSSAASLQPTTPPHTPTQAFIENTSPIDATDVDEDQHEQDNDNGGNDDDSRITPNRNADYPAVTTLSPGSIDVENDADEIQPVSSSTTNGNSMASGKTKPAKPWNFVKDRFKPKKNVSESPVSPIERYVMNNVWDDSAGGVLFTCRANVFYDGTRDHDVPVYSAAMTFQDYDFIQIVKVLNQQWWLGRVIGQGARTGFIPTPANFGRKYDALQKQKERNKAPAARKFWKRGKRGSQGSVDPATTIVPPPTPINLFNKFTIKDTSLPYSVRQTNLPYFQQAPKVRPLILIGPSRPAYEVTDKMQRALYGYLRTTFKEKCVYLELKQAKKKRLDSAGLRPTSPIGEDDMLDSRKEVFEPEDIKRVLEIGEAGKLAIINSDCWDVPALRRSAMMPLLVLLKISSTSVLSKVIRARGKVPHKVLSLQIQAADKLNSLSEDLFDLVLTQSKLDQSCYELTAYVGAYLAEALMKPKLDPELKEHQ